MVQVIQLRSNSSDVAKVGANFGSSAGEKVTIVLFLALLQLGGIQMPPSKGFNVVASKGENP